MITYNSDIKPQTQFINQEDAIDLNFTPKLKVKHNYIKPWVNERTSSPSCSFPEILGIPDMFFQDSYMRELGIDPKTQLISIYRNPYSYEIHSNALSSNSSSDIKFPTWEIEETVSYTQESPVDVGSIQWIEDEESVLQLVQILKRQRVIGVSVIQHSYRSYLGYCSVIMVFVPTCFN